MRRVTRGQHHLHHKQTPVRPPGSADMPENCQALFFAPVVNDMRKDIGVAAGWDPLEKGPRLDGDSVLDSSGGKQRRRVRQDMWPVKQDAARPGMARQDGREQVPGRTSDIDDGSEDGEVICICYGGRLLTMYADHGFAEQ